MVGVFIAFILVVLFLLAFIGFIIEKSYTDAFQCIPLFALISGIILGPVFGVIAITEHNPREYAEKVEIQSVDIQNGVYVFTTEDGRTVAKPSGDVIVSEVSEEPGIQYGTTYYSWGNWWPTPDWDGREVILFTPSNKG